MGFKKTSDELSEEYASYISYVYKMLSDNNILLKNSIDSTDEVYQKYTSGSISLSEFLEHAIISNYIDFNSLGIEITYIPRQNFLIF